MGVLFFRPGQADELNVLFDDAIAAFGRHFRVNGLHSKADVFFHRHPGHQRIVLEDHAAIRARASNGHAIQQDVAARNRH